MTTLYCQNCHLCQTHYQLHLLVPTPQPLKTLTLMIFPGDLKSWKRKHRLPKPGKVQVLGNETEQFLLVTKNLHEILLHLLTITEYTLPLGSLPALTHSAAFRFSIAPERLTTGDGEVGAAGSWQPCLSISCQCDPISLLPVPPSLHRGVRRGELSKMAGWWRRVLHEVSQLCAEVLDLETKPFVQRDWWWVRFKARLSIFSL